MDQQQHSPPQPPGDHAAQPLGWERFVHKKTVTVLLVETDEFTRNDITTMLRRCKYQVIAAENGRQAWAFLQVMNSSIDLVLTEVDLFGIELLDRIMGHRFCKDIPVIMMSPYCPTATVFDCLCKGAVDFLHKPIRKHEMKNLWLHVWRRCQNSNGSGSGSGSPVQTHEFTKPKSGQGSNTLNDDAIKGLNPRDVFDNGSGTQSSLLGTQYGGSGSHVHALKYTNPKLGPESNNNNGSNDRNDDARMGLNAKDGNDNSSGTQGQNSWTKRAVEIDSPQTMSPDQSTESPDSTCEVAIHPNSERCSTRWLPDGKWLEIGDSINANTNDESCPNRPTNRRCEYPPHDNSNASTMENLEQPIVQTADLIGSMANSNDEFKGKGLEIYGPIYVNTHDESCPNGNSTKSTDRWSAYPRRENPNASSMEILEEPNVRAADLIGSMAKNMDAQQAVRAKDAPTSFSKVPSLELSLKRPRSTGYYANKIQKATRNIISRPDLSALMRIFSRHNNTCVVSNQSGAGYLRSSSPPNSSETVKTDCSYNLKPSSDASVLKQGKDTKHDDNRASLELSLKRTRSNGDGANAIQENKTNVLRPSDLPAFTRYNAPNQGGVGGLVGSCSPDGNNSEAVKTGCPYNMKQSSDASLMQQGEDKNRDDNTSSLKLSSRRLISTGYYADAIQMARWNVLRPDLSNQGGVGGLVSSCSLHGISSEAVKTGYPYNMKPSSDASLMKQGKDMNHDDNMTSLELSFKKPRSTGHGADAFTRYGNISETVETGCPYKMKSRLDARPRMQGSNGSISNNNNMGGTRTNVVTKPGGNKISPITDNADEVRKKNGRYRAGEAQSKCPSAVHDENGGSAVVGQSNVADPWAPFEGSNSGSYNNISNGSTAGAAVNTRAAGLNRYREKKKKRNFTNMWHVRYEARKISAEQRPRVRGQFARQPPPADATAAAAALER